MPLFKLSGVPRWPDFLQNWLPLLPQYSQINLSTAKIWHAELSQSEPLKLAWHFKNLARLTTTDITEITHYSMSQGQQRTQAVRQIINDKQLINLPRKPDLLSRRNALLKPMAATLFKEDFLAKTQVSALKTMSTHRIGWMHDYIDDVVEISGKLGGVIYVPKTDDCVPQLADQIRLQIADYLWADSQSLAHIPFKELEMRTSPLQFDFMLAVYLDYDAGTVTPIKINYNGALMRTVIEAGDGVWEYIKTGEGLSI